MAEEFSNMGERMAVLETKVDDIKKDISEIKDMLKNIDSKYALKSEIITAKSEADTKIATIEKRMDSTTLWIRSIAVALISTIILLFLKYVFNI